MDSALARGLTTWLIGAFHRDTTLLVIDRSGKTRPRGPQPEYAVATDLERARNRLPRLIVRVVDVKAVYLVAVDSASGPADSLQRALPAMADRLGQRLQVLHAIRRPDRPPPHWRVPIEALRAYSLAPLYIGRGDTGGARNATPISGWFARPGVGTSSTDQSAAFTSVSAPSTTRARLSPEGASDAGAPSNIDGVESGP